MIKIGCCGFPKKREVYFRNFLCVELQNTFYQPSKNLDVFKRLKDQTPPSFDFSIKAWQIITHPISSPTYRRLKESFGNPKNYGFFKPTKEVFTAYERIFEIAKILEAKAILFQSPPTFKEEEGNVKNMYRFFGEIRRDNLQLFWEQRSDFKLSTIRKICQDLDIFYARDPFKHKEEVNKKIIYFRLHGKGSYRYKFTDEDLLHLKSLVKGKGGYVFFNNVYMWKDALRFKAFCSSK